MLRLVSKSPRRREILEMAGIEFVVTNIDTDEDIVEKNKEKAKKKQEKRGVYENQIREVYGLEGTPVRFVIRERNEKSKY